MRIRSETRDIPDAFFDVSIKELPAWAIQEFGDLEQEIRDEVRFVIDVARHD
jgi:hypothetical protein